MPTSIIQRGFYTNDISITLDIGNRRKIDTGSMKTDLATDIH